MSCNHRMSIYCFEIAYFSCQKRSHLSNIYDLERLFRKIKLMTIHPADWIQIIESLRSLSALGYEVKNGDLSFLEYCLTHLDEKEIGKYHLDNISQTFFQKGVYICIDELQTELDDHISQFDQIARFFHQEFFKVDFNEREGYYLTITSKRFNDIKSTLQDRHDIKVKDLETKLVSSSSAVLKIHHDAFKKMNERILVLKDTLSTMTTQIYKEFVKLCEDRFSPEFDKCVQFIEDLDFTVACAYNATKHKHTCPSVDESSGPFCDIKDLRHPIVEHLNQHVQFVANDVFIKENGMLLYGLNSAGKSTFMKSCGIAVIMAQAGMFVPCSSMSFSPFKHIFTRIPSGDDIMKGQSTFTVEINELRNILYRADRFSLVIGDELCSGTESISAMSIVSAGIFELCTRKVAFIFATHLHDLKNISHIKSLQNLKIYHLSVLFDEESGKLIYNRKLTEGQGSSLYGLEVCKSLSLGEEFIAKANEIRREILNIDQEVLRTKTSSYNSKKYVDATCDICHEKSVDIPYS